MDMNRKIDTNAIRGLIQQNYLKNRTTVSKEMSSLIDDIEKMAGIKVIRHKFKTGEEHGTWITPPQWDVTKAFLKHTKTGKTIASYDEHPLFVCPYSCSVDKTMTKDELSPHLFMDQHQKDAYSYNHRLAYDPNLMLNTWQISIPYERYLDLDEGPYHILIETEVSLGEMIVAEILIKGRQEKQISFLAHYCHPGQVNDNFSSIGVLSEVIRTLAGSEDLNYSYSFLFFPETIGSSIYLAANPHIADRTVGALCVETVGWGEKWYLKSTRLGNTYFDTLAHACIKNFPGLTPTSFMTINRNDELVFDSIQTNIPTLALQKFPYKEYHTSHDNVSHLQDEDLSHAYNIILYLIYLAEQNTTFSFVHNVPFHMSRYGLYADAVYDEKKCQNYRNIMNSIDGKASVLDIALKLDLSFDEVNSYISKMHTHGLVSDLRES